MKSAVKSVNVCKSLVPALAIIFFGLPVLAQSFNGAGRMNANSPTGWGANPNNYAGTPYANPYNTGFGNGWKNAGNPYYSNLGAGPVFPFGTPFINPRAMGNGFYNFNGGGYNANLWRAPSGYYYPFYGTNSGYSQIIYVDQSNNNQAVAKAPPLSMQFTDMAQFIEDAHKNHKVSEADYQSLTRRLKDIQSKERSLRIAGDGYLEDSADAEIRQNLTDFSREMTERIKL